MTHDKYLRFTEEDADELFALLAALEDTYSTMCLIDDLGSLGIQMEDGNEEGFRTLIEAVWRLIEPEKEKLTKTTNRLYAFLWKGKVAEARAPKGGD